MGDEDKVAATPVGVEVTAPAPVTAPEVSTEPEAEPAQFLVVNRVHVELPGAEPVIHHPGTVVAVTDIPASSVVFLHRLGHLVLVSDLHPDQVEAIRGQIELRDAATERASEAPDDASRNQALAESTEAAQTIKAIAEPAPVDPAPPVAQVAPAPNEVK